MILTMVPLIAECYGYCCQRWYDCSGCEWDLLWCPCKCNTSTLSGDVLMAGQFGLSAVMTCWGIVKVKALFNPYLIVWGIWEFCTSFPPCCWLATWDITQHHCATVHKVFGCMGLNVRYSFYCWVHIGESGINVGEGLHCAWVHSRLF